MSRVTITHEQGGAILRAGIHTVRAVALDDVEATAREMYALDTWQLDHVLWVLERVRAMPL